MTIFAYYQHKNPEVCGIFFPICAQYAYSHFWLLGYLQHSPITGGKKASASSAASEAMLGLESIFARSLLRNSSKCDLMWRWDADLKAAVHESRSACKQVREDTENGQKMKKPPKNDKNTK